MAEDKLAALHQRLAEWLFAPRRFRLADDHMHRMLDNRIQCMPSDAVWLVGERRSTAEQEYGVSNRSADATRRVLASRIKARWIFEQSHQWLKKDLGLDYLEGR